MSPGSRKVGKHCCNAKALSLGQKFFVLLLSLLSINHGSPFPVLRLENHDLVWKYASWLLEKDQALAAKVSHNLASYVFCK